MRCELDFATPLGCRMENCAAGHFHVVREYFFPVCLILAGIGFVIIVTSIIRQILKARAARATAAGQD